MKILPRFVAPARSRFVSAIFVGVVLGGSMGDVAFAASADGATDRKPNFVLCMADDMGFGDVAYNGIPDVQTPTLDELARSAVRFDQFYSASCVCSPTRGSFLTGRHPARYGVFSWGWSLRPAETTIAEALVPHGYAAGHFGKWHLGTLHKGSATSPAGQGFTEFASSPNFYENDPLFSVNGKVVQTQGESSEVTVDAALDFIERSAAAKQPFAAVVWFGNPHTPHEAVDELRKPYASLDETMQHYWGEITGIDRAMAKLRRRLRELNLADDTLLLFTSDNGAAKPGSVGPLKGMKGSLWEGGIRVPALIEWPGRVKGPKVVSVPCGTVDILPTVLAAAGIAHPQPQRPLDGQSLLPLVDGTAEARTQPLGFWTYPNPGRGVRSSEVLRALAKADPEGTGAGLPPLADYEEAGFAAKYPVDEFPAHAVWVDGNYKLHCLPMKSGVEQFQLYDLAADVGEKNDLAAEQPDRVKVMATALRTWQRSVLNSLNGGDYESP